ncbi:MAG: YCF48-related protein [Bacteroidetes bacterium]|nr:YCF48-related protein [Bacteroidota bacterium]
MKPTILFCILIAIFGQLSAQQGWQYQNSNLANNQFGAIYAISGDIVYVISDQGKFVKTMDGGSSWVVQNTGVAESFFDVAFVNTNTGYAVGHHGTIIKTTDGGTTWTLMASGTTKDLFSLFIKAAGNVWVVGDSGVILNSQDGGSTWLNNGGLTQKQLNSIAFRDANTGFIAGNAGTLFKTTDGGGNWNPVSIATTKDLYSVTITGNCVYFLAGSVYDYMFGADQIYKTTDNVNWTNFYPGLGSQGFSRLYFQNDSLGFTIFSDCTTNGDCMIEISKTTDYGQNWSTSFDNWNPPSLVGIAYSDIVFVTDSIGYALSGNNILKTTDGGTFVGVGELNNDHFFKMFPNPASPGILKIELTNIDVAALTIEISDIRGRILYTAREPGHSNTLDLSGIKRGVYFVKLIRGNSIVEVQKLVITE